MITSELRKQVKKIIYLVFSVADDRNLCKMNVLLRCRSSYTLWKALLNIRVII